MFRHRFSFPSNAVSAVASVALASTAIVATAGGSAANGTATPGAPGVGDPYFPDLGNGGYDVATYDIDVAYNPDDASLQGTTTVHATATQHLSRFNLDFKLDVTSVTVNGKAAQFSTEGDHELVITPAKALPEGRAFHVTVEYSGKPLDKGPFGSSRLTRTNDGGLLIQGVPASGMWWFPANEHPTDTATFDVSITTPADFTGVSIGRNISTTTQGGRKTEQWTHHVPVPTYYALFCAGKFDVTKGHNFRLRSRSYVAMPAEGYSEEQLDRARTDLARTDEVIAWLQKYYGPYPFANHGGVVAAMDRPYGFEAATRPVYSTWFWERGQFMDVVVVLNAFHYFGGSVGIASWRDEWLSLAFAQWTSELWGETHDGQGPGFYFKDVYNDIDADKPWWTVKIADPGAEPVTRGPLFYRGSMTLQALRTRLGDDVFFDIIKTWTSSNRGGVVSTADFIALAEAKSGQDLDEFFNVWLYTGEKPAATAENGFPADMIEG